MTKPHLVGLDSVKSEVQELINFLKIQQVRKARSLPTAGLSLHVVFYGNPGTGKTTVARLLSRIYRALGVVSKGHLIETDRSGMVAGYVGQTALKVTEIVEQALGGVLFIDEAYSLADGDEGSYGREAIDTLIKLMEDHRENLAVVIAGYTGKIEKFLSTNPGLKSRFNRYWKFDDYTPQQLLSIFESFCTKGHFRLSLVAKNKLKTVLQTAYEQRDESFGNARLVRNLYESSISNQASRIVGYGQISDDVLITIEAEDVPDVVETL
jgi:stage V sporulation protein K